MKFSSKLVTAISFLFVANIASANLIVNGSFEDTTLSENAWNWYSSASIPGWDGSNIELWNSFDGVDAFDGENHAELNAHPSYGSQFTIYQTFSTVAGSVYDLSFAYQARASENESFLVEVMSGSDTVYSSLVDDHLVGSWSEIFSSFVATDTSSTISFSSITPYSGTVGNFIDAIYVDTSDIEVNEVSAPSMIAILLMGLTFVSARRFTK